MKIALCDDSNSDLKMLKECLIRLEKETNNEFSITNYNDPERLIQDYQSENIPELVFLDIYMNDTLGTDTAKKLRDLGYRGSIIFCTSSEDHALEGFKVKADGYLVKPFTYKEFRDAIWRLDNLFIQKQKKVSFVSERIEYDLPVSDIVLIETSKKGSIVHTEKEQLFTWKRLKDFIAEIDSEGFYQTGRNYFINIDRIESINSEYIIMETGIKIDIPKMDSIKIRQDINNYIWRTMRE